MPTVMITGGTGMIGTSLSRLLLQQGYDVIILSRNPVETATLYKTTSQQNSFRPSGKIFYAKWDMERMTIDQQALSSADHIVHLAGEGVAKKRWTRKRKQEIRESRTRSSELLYQALANQPNKVKSVISASAIGWYGPDTGRPFVETDAASDDFLGETCKAWEESIDKVGTLQKRLVKLRLGIALSNEGGALVEFKRPARLGVAAVLGSGKQMVSWIHIDDLCRAFIHAIETPSMHGVYNLVAPEPVNNRDLVIGVAHSMNGNFFLPLPVPSLVLKLALGEISVEVLKSATVNSSKIQETGFSFIYPNIHAALRHLIG
ncbi:MAG: TIGR01777 family oxidoreductase [Bacteroidota bacterium]